MNEFDAFLAERDAIFRTLDIKRAREKDARGVSDAVILIGLHKARYEATSIEPELRRASRQWLQERGYKRMGQMEFSADGSLPGG